MELNDILKKVHENFPKDQLVKCKNVDEETIVALNFIDDTIIKIVEHYEMELKKKDQSNRRLMSDAFNTGVMSVSIDKKELTEVTKDPILTGIILKKLSNVQDLNFDALKKQFKREDVGLEKQLQLNAKKND